MCQQIYLNRDIVQSQYFSSKNIAKIIDVSITINNYFHKSSSEENFFLVLIGACLPNPIQLEKSVGVKECIAGLLLISS